jgi:hypothetical protein
VAAASSATIASAPVVASSPTSASSPQVTSAPVPASTPVLQVAVFGDDAMAGVGGTEWWTRISPDEADALQMLLQSEFNNTGITLGNNARGGTASSLMNMLDGMDGSGAPFTAILAEIPAPIVIDNHAVNDALGGETLSDYSGYLVQFITDVRAAGKIPVLEEPGPVCDGNHPQLPQYVAAMDAVALQYGVALIKQYAYISGVAGWCGHMAQGFYPDAYIDQLKAKQEQAVIAPLVQAIVGGS